MLLSETPVVDYVNGERTSRGALQALMNALQLQPAVTKVWLLTTDYDHALIVVYQDDKYIAIQGGLSSGRPSEGTKTLSKALAFIDSLGLSIHEILVPFGLMNRLIRGGLTQKDISTLDAGGVGHGHWPNYILPEDWESSTTRQLWDTAEPMIPMAIIDPRLRDIAIRFWKSPDSALMDGYRRLECCIRGRIDCNSRGIDIFGKAFGGKQPQLAWQEELGSGDSARQLLFRGVFQAYRNARAHNELQTSPNESLTEFLLLNHLFLLEAAAVNAPSPDSKPF